MLAAWVLPGSCEALEVTNVLKTKVVDRRVAEIEDLLRSVGTILRKRGRDILAGFDITPPQFDALLVLREYGELTMGELCAKMFLACSTATDLIDRMERNDLIARVRDPQDRRVIRLKVLEKGARVIEEVLEARRQYLASILAEVSEAQRDQMIEALERINLLMNREIEQGD
jgi:DNA-binding MarR family transcriptional regulator